MPILAQKAKQIQQIQFAWIIIYYLATFFIQICELAHKARVFLDDPNKMQDMLLTDALTSGTA